jgi:hypothetical protein
MMKIILLPLESGDGLQATLETASTPAAITLEAVLFDSGRPAGCCTNAALKAV